MSNTPKIRFSGFTDDWKQKRIIECASFSKGYGYSKSDIRDKGTPLILYGRLYTKHETVIENVDTFAIPTKGSVYSCGGEVIVPASGETAEDIAIASVVRESGVLLGGDLNVITTNDEIDPAFLALSISNGRTHRELSKLAQGKSVVHIHNSDIQSVSLRFPDKIEQEIISGFLVKTDGLIRLHQREYEKLVALKAACLDKMFPKSGCDLPEVRFEGFIEKWKPYKIKEVADRYDNLRIPVAANFRIPGTTPYYGANGVQDYVDGFTHEGEFVLVAEDGANDLKNYPVQYVQGKIWVNNHAHVLQSKPGIANNPFLAYAINRADIESFLVGGGRAKLNAETLMDIKIFMPCVEEQQKIGLYLNRVETLITLQKRKVEKLKQLKQSMLHNMFV